ncbi:hypothetical protein MEQU1_000554 [Malassezia equina]|uniref:Pentatricopeptide repeat-containing protein n=1 Tax=Malassezia equina TaxID=1381935 RepID=A0AAF0J2E4_9BASI|nr:hypothetical protein MEQU1_000554 [Malassezia equina]
MWGAVLRRRSAAIRAPAYVRSFTAPAAQVAELRAGLAARDLEQVWEAWDALRTTTRLDRLRRHDHADILALVRAHLPALAPAQSRAPSWAERCRAWGMDAAQRMDVLGVQGWMRVELLCGQPGEAIRLFQAYLDARRRARPAGKDVTLLLDAGAVRPAALHDLLALLILCYAAENDLRGLVDMMRSFDVGTHTQLYFDYTQCARQYGKVRWPPGTQQQVDDMVPRALSWVSHAELARGLLDGSGGLAGPNRMARLLGSLFARGDVPNACRLIQAAMDAGVRPQGAKTAWLASPSLSTADQLCAWTDSCWAVSLSGVLAARRQDLASQLWACVGETQLRIGPAWPPWSLWNAVLDGYSRAGDLPSVLATWRVLTHQVSAHELPLARGASVCVQAPTNAPDLVCYTTMMAALFRQRHGKEAIDLFTQLRAQPEVRIPVETYNAVVHGLCVTRHMREAQAIVQSMGQGSVPPPTITTINILLRAHARQKNLPAMAATLRQIPSLGLRPDVITFTTVLDALLRRATTRQDAEAAVSQVQQIMQSMHVPPNSVTFTAMIKACLHVKGDKEPRMRVALQLMHTMCTTMKLAPTAVTFETIIAGLLTSSRPVDVGTEAEWPPLFATPPPRLPGEEADVPPHAKRLALVLWHQLPARQLAPTPDTYHVLVRALLAEADDVPLFRRGVLVADELLRARGALAVQVGLPRELVMQSVVPPAPASWTVVLHALLRAHKATADPTLVARVLEAVLAHFSSSEEGAAAVLPPSPTYHTGNLRHYIEEAANVLK